MAKRNTKTKKRATTPKQPAPASVTRATIAGATVRLPDLDGHGVLVPGGCILTAAHCVPWAGKFGMALSDDATIVVTPTGARGRAVVLAAEPRADVAVLAPPLDEEALGRWCDDTEPAQLAGIEDHEPMPVFVLSRTGRRIPATATPYGPQPMMAYLQANEPIPQGSSGSPVVHLDGRLVGVLTSTADRGNGTYDGYVPIARWTLPAWVWERIDTAQKSMHLPTSKPTRRSLQRRASSHR